MLKDSAGFELSYTLSGRPSIDELGEGADGRPPAPDQAAGGVSASVWFLLVARGSYEHTSGGRPSDCAFQRENEQHDRNNPGEDDNGQIRRERKPHRTGRRVRNADRTLELGPWRSGIGGRVGIG